MADWEGTIENLGSELVDFNGPDDPAIARNWPPRRKWAIIAILSTMSFVTPLASSIFAPSVPQCLAEFGSNSTILGSLVVSIYILGYAAGPLAIAPLSELYGRSPMYHATNIGFIIFTVACAVSTNLTMLICFRFLEGVAGSAVLTIGGGTVADLFVQEERGRALAFWTLGPILGPVIGPVAGSFLSASKGWRWVFWLLAIVSGSITASFLILLRETSSTAILRKQAKRARKTTGNPHFRSCLDGDQATRQAFHKSIIRPIKLLVGSPIVASMSTFAAIIYGYLYLLFTSFTPVFEQSYGFSPDVVGLCYLGTGFGMIVSLFGFGVISDRMIKMKSIKNKGEMKPEYRLPPMILGGIFVPIGLLLYGWSAEKQVFWFVPILGTAFFGFGFMASFMPIQAYLVDVFTVHAASALAAATVWRSIVGALLPLAGLPMYNALGLGWGNTLLGLLGVAMIPVPFLLITYGEQLRSNPRYRVDSW